MCQAFKQSTSRYRLSYPVVGVGTSGSCTLQAELENGKVVRYERGYGIDDEVFARVFLTRLPLELADVLDVAMAVYTIE